ncbi:N-acetyltransferase [Pullulanibacillus camelliae]|uniref:N-acetyltransferase n=1 Tax=Pullulanibacillus camelliae TaxID=1707096 RepID=A0A8J2VN51_9BACL|nr:N-acetyltransferase [Pullulanibacillus camelliae]
MILRAIESQDWEAFHVNDEDSEAARLSDIIYPPRSTDAAQKWAEEQALKEKEGHDWMLAIESLETEQVAGTIVTYNSDQTNGSFYYGLAIFRPYWRRGYAKEAIHLLMNYFFNELRYQKVNAHVYSFNKASIRLHEHLGFQLEGRLRQMIYSQGSFHDELIFGCTAQEFYEQLGQSK